MEGSHMNKNLFGKIYLKFYNKSLKIKKKLSNDTDLKKLIDNNEIISFDIFDTVIVRKVLEPKDIFIIIEQIYNKRFKTLKFNFQYIRSIAEPQAKKISKNKNRSLCLNIDEIYDHIQQTQNLDNETINRLKSIEIEVELKFCIRNEYMYSFYQYCIDHNKKVIFTSDMYLSEEVVSTILKKNGYTKFHKLYLSSVIRKSKSNGSLYSYIINDISCQPSKMLHIGDYFFADIINSMKVGINSFYYKKSNDYALEHDYYKRLRNLYSPQLSIEESIYFAAIINRIFTDRNNNEQRFWYNFGYIYCGIIYFSFTRWLIEQVIDSDVEKVFFLARDGYIMNESYKLLNEEKRSPPNTYMYASRRAVNIPTIHHDIDDHALKVLCHPFPNLNVSDFLGRVDIDANKHLEKIIDVGFIDKNHIIKTDKDKLKLSKLFTLLAEDVFTVSAEERKNLISYLEQINFINLKKVAIVDIGWQGTIQHSLTKLMLSLNKKIKINGYYLGTFATAKQFVNKGLSISGYMCNFSKPQQNFDVVDGCVHIFEFIFSAPHGSVIKFGKAENTIKPICEPYDGTSSKSKTIIKFQQGALDFIRDFKETEKDFKEINISAESAIKPLSRLLNNPTYDETVYFGNLKHSEYVGEHNYNTYLAKASSPWKMYLNPFRFKKEYYSSLWKVGFKKRYMGYILPKNFLTSLKPFKKH